MKAQSEHLHQVQFVSWWRKNYPQYWIFAIPNGGHRSRSEGAKLKAEGVLKGVVDLCVPALNLWIEFKKDEKQKPTKEQKDFMAYVEGFNHVAFVAYSFEDGKNKALDFLESI